MQERGREVTPHALTQRELTHRHVEQRSEIEQFREPLEVRAVPPLLHAIDVPQQIERLPERQIPPQLRSLAEHGADPQREMLPVPCGLRTRAR